MWVFRSLQRTFNPCRPAGCLTEAEDVQEANTRGLQFMWYISVDGQLLWPNIDIIGQLYCRSSVTLDRVAEALSARAL